MIRQKRAPRTITSLFACLAVTLSGCGQSAPATPRPSAREALENPRNDLLVSAATRWELSSKVNIGKLALGLTFRPWMESARKH